MVPAEVAIEFGITGAYGILLGGAPATLRAIEQAARLLEAGRCRRALVLVVEVFEECAELYARHRGGLYRFVLRQCGTRAVADDLFQDVWMNLITARSRYVPSAKFSTFLYQVARNRVIDHFRTLGRNLEDPEDPDDHTFRFTAGKRARSARSTRVEQALLRTLRMAIDCASSASFLTEGLSNLRLYKGG